MAQDMRPCPRCGAPNALDKRACSNCGAILVTDYQNAATSVSSSTINNAQSQGQSWRAAQLPTDQRAPVQPSLSSFPPQGYAQGGQAPLFPPGYGQSNQPAQPSTLPAPGYTPSNQPPTFLPPAYPPPSPTMPSLPPFVSAPQEPTRKGSKRFSAGVIFLLVLILLVCSGTSYAGYKWVSALVKNNAPTSTPQPVATQTATMNATLTYASVAITITGVQETTGFADDTSETSPMVLRVNLKEHNPISQEVFLSYPNMQLVFPDGTAEVPNATLTSDGIAQGATRTNWLDYPLTASVPIAKLLVRFGAPNEAQMDVPLNGSAKLSRYAATTVNLKTVFQYAGLQWTITSATIGLSSQGQQADSGMEYVVVTLSINNPTSNEFFPFPNDDIRLKAGADTNAPTGTTLAIGLTPGATGVTGTITFEAPQNTHAFTLVMLARGDTNPPTGQVMANFKV